MLCRSMKDRDQVEGKAVRSMNEQVHRFLVELIETDTPSDEDAVVLREE